MKCPKCQADNADDAKFCIKCGASTESLCPNCGATTPPPHRKRGEGGFHLCPLGVCVWKRSRDDYEFHLWRSLSLYTVARKRGLIGLRTEGGDFLKLKPGSDFDEVEWAVLENLPNAREEVSADKLRNVSKKTFVLIMAMFIVGVLGAWLYYGYFYGTGRPGDHECDVCGLEGSPGWQQVIVTEVWEGGKKVRTERELVNITEIWSGDEIVGEYCQRHAFAYLITHPEACVSTILSDPEGWDGGVAFPLVVHSGLWAAAGMLAFGTSITRWAKATALRQ